MNTNLVVSAYELQRGSDRLTVYVDPTLGKSVRVGDIDAFKAFLGDDTNGNGAPNGGTVTSKPAAGRRASRRASGDVAAPASTAAHSRASEWTFTEDQRKRLTSAIQDKGAQLSDVERRVLQARFMSKAAPSTTQLAQDLGLKHSSEVTLLTRSGLRHAGIRVPRLRKTKRSKR